MEKKLQKIYHTYYNLLIVLNLWQAHLQILLIIYMKEFIELNVNQDTVSIASIKKKKNLKQLIKMEKKLQKIYHTYYVFLIVQNLWQAHLKILLIVYLKDFIELNVNQNMMSIASISIVFQNIQTLKTIQQNKNAYDVTKVIV